MFVEMRTYTAHPGRLRDYLALYEAEALALQLRYLERMVGYYSTETGELNQVVHLWAYESLDDRSRRRTAMLADPAFQAYVRRMTPMLLRQESCILRPTTFFTPTWQTASVPPAPRA